MKKSSVLTIAAVLMLSSNAVAQNKPDMTVEDKIAQRISAYQETVSKASAAGKLNGKQVASDNKRIAAIQEKVRKAKEKHKGQLTSNDQIRIYKALNEEELKEQAQERKPTSRHKKH